MIIFPTPILCTEELPTPSQILFFFDKVPMTKEIWGYLQILRIM